ncbi:uncharacterized protein LOC129305436 [Prosopis cineraria]|uniref:uncharacterized protein LOC129305436 n=1 Tax=Prosopis cineraria TaxID=364024 RepID=UPI00240F086D|nr:uncharacterized protein LOC129305436 [Prosopis cineraria]
MVGAISSTGGVGKRAGYSSRLSGLGNNGSKKKSFQRGSHSRGSQMRSNALRSMGGQSQASRQDYTPMVARSIRAPQCSGCGRYHTGECWICFKFYKVRHIAQYCPKNTPHTDQRSIIPGRAFAMTREEAKASSKLIQGMISLSNQRISVLFDSGATHSFVSDECPKD